MGLASDTKLEIEEDHFAPIREFKNGASITVGALRDPDEDEKDQAKVGWSIDELIELRFGEHDGTVHAIAVSSMAYQGEAGHLLNAEGLVVGDYVVQMQMLQAMVPTS